MSALFNPSLAAAVTLAVMALVGVVYLIAGVIENRRDASFSSYMNRRAIRRARLNRLARGRGR